MRMTLDLPVCLSKVSEMVRGGMAAMHQAMMKNGGMMMNGRMMMNDGLMKKR